MPRSIRRSILSPGRLLGAAAVLGCIAAATAQAPTPAYIADLRITSSRLPGNWCEDGWQRIRGDLNDGAGGRFVQLCVTRTPVRDSAVNFLDLNLRDTADPACDAGAFLSAGPNLNEGARVTGRGGFLYLCYTKVGSLPIGERSASAHPVVDIVVAIDTKPGAPCADVADREDERAWRVLGGPTDLNHGTRGKIVHLCYKVAR